MLTEAVLLNILGNALASIRVCYAAYSTKSFRSCRNRQVVQILQDTARTESRSTINDFDLNHLLYLGIMPPKETSSRQSSSTSSRSEGQPRRSSTTRQLITFVDSQDPNSRSTIQRHTAHHSNAQRRDARLQSLRSNRPRLLEWQRRPSVEGDTITITSPSSSRSSASISPAPILSTTAAAPSDISPELSLLVTSTLEQTSMFASGRSESPVSPLEDEILTACKPNRPRALTILRGLMLTTFFADLSNLCAHGNQETFRDVLNYICATDVASRCLMIAYMLALRCRGQEGTQAEADRTNAQRNYGRGTRLLRDRLTSSNTASSDENIQAVLLLIAYAADIGTPEEVSIHTSALRRMITQRGGLPNLTTSLPSPLVVQLNAVGVSRCEHLTLQCASNCQHRLRFPAGVNVT